MKTLLIPCAGKSSRFPNMKPKWMLTHPDGKLMVEKSLEGIDTSSFDRIIITIVKEIDLKFDAQLILKQVFEKYNKKIEICVLDDYTSSQSHTVAETIKKMNIKGVLTVKDSDNFVKCILPDEKKSSVVGYDLRNDPTISNIPGKSFIIANEQNIINDIFEKNVLSNIICIGVYTFSDTDEFLSAFNTLNGKVSHNELYLSHIVSYMIAHKIDIFNLIIAEAYEDWGTLLEWHNCQTRHTTYFVDVDGVLLRNSGKYGKINWSNNTVVLSDNMDTLKKLYDEGAQIVITTSRDESYKSFIEELLQKHGIIPHSIITNLYHSSRVIINDFASTNPYPSARGINIPRNGSLKEYIE